MISPLGGTCTTSHLQFLPSFLNTWVPFLEPILDVDYWGHYLHSWVEWVPFARAWEEPASLQWAEMLPECFPIFWSCFGATMVGGRY